MKILGLDLGTKSLGMAITDKLGLIANPYKVIKYDDEDFLFDELDKIIKNEQVEKMVLGLPKNMNNSIGFAGKRSLEFKEKLNERYDLEVILIDERLSTKEAESVLIQGNVRREKRKKIIDRMAACIILENYLNRRGE